jgi:hypothetical protein
VPGVPNPFPSIDTPLKPEPKPAPVPIGTPPAVTPTNYGKPPGTPDLSPPVAQAVPKSGFDVDVYDPKASDTYDSISQDYYNDKKYAAALRAFNENRPLQGGRYVDVPPIHVLKKRFPTLVQTVPARSPAPTTSGSNPSSLPEWNAPSRPEPARPSGNGSGTFIVPSGGMSIVTAARQVGVSWRDVYDLNLSYTPDAVLPAGTELRMPANARLP